ncbi:hypothetical protein LCGC14_0771070, partial [marine sediment metagenome]
NLLDTNKALIVGNDPILIDDLEMNGFEIKVDVSSADMSGLAYIEIIPTFRQDGIYHPDNQEGQPNAIGVENFEYLNWDEELTIFENGEKFMAFPLEKVLKIDNPPFAYLFNERLQYLEQPAGVSFSWETYPNAYTQLDEYTLMIPNKYLNPNNPTEELTFKDGDSIVLRYNTPMRKGIGIAIGKMYFQKKPAGYSPTLPSAEALLLNIDDYDDYSTYTDPYNYQIPLELTPFDTEFTNSFKNIEIDIDLLDGQIDPQYIVDNLIDFSDIIFSSPYPNYELTINDVLIRSISDETIDISTTFYERVWQFTELETFISDDDPSDGVGDTYTLQRVKDPLFWGDNKWLDYIMIYDDSYNYYEAIATPPSEVNHQLHFVSGSDYFEWNSNFDQFQDYYGYQMKLPLIVEPNSQLSFTYVSQDSWQNPILLDEADIDLGSLEIMFDYENYLIPRYEFWGDTVYENTVYDYQAVQYYSESFTVYSASEGSDYTHIFDPSDYSFIDDFTNLQLFKVIGLKPTMETVEIITDGDNTVSFFISTQQIQITDSDGQNGDLNDFDLITVILSYSYGPISSFSEIQLNQSFHDTYISDSEATFYDHIAISYSYSALSGENLLDQNSDVITSGATSFKYIPFNRNPFVSTDNTLNDQNSELYIEFEMFSDPFNVIYEADLDMDGRKDYKQEIDIDKDGIFDIIKYGVEDAENPEDIIWYSIIQDVYTEEVTVDKSIEEEKLTEWFDINDAVFSDYGFNVLLLLASILAMPLLLYTLSTMILPDVDYWAQKSITQTATETKYTKSHYYSIRRDDNLDGFIDTQITYEKTDTVVEYVSNDYEKTIIAAKPQNVFQYLGDYIAKSIDAFSGKPTDDNVFNKHLTEEKLDARDFSRYSDSTASMLEATYRKFTKDTTITQTSEFSQEKITVTDWVEGEIEQTRVYQDLFDESIIAPSSSSFTIRNTENGQEESMPDNVRAMTTPEDEGWDLETWEENIHQKFDAITTIFNDGTITTGNVHEEDYTIVIPGRFNLYNDIYENNPDMAIKNSRFRVTGVLATPQDGFVYYTSDKELFKDGNAKTPGNYLYFDSDNNNFYETVYILGEPVTEYNERSGLSTTVYHVKSIGYNYDGSHEFAPYKHVNREIITQTDFEQLASETPKRFGAYWIVNFRKLRDNSLLFPDDPFDGYEAKDHIFEVYKLAEPSEFNSKFPKLFYEVRHQTYSDAWSIYSSQLAQDTAEQVFMTLTASAASAPLQAIPIAGQVLGTLAYIGVYTLMTKFSIDLKRHKADAMQKAFTFTPVSLDEMKPKTLNERSPVHAFWEESTIAALMGHPGAYYTTVQGEVENQIYTAQAIVSPHNLLRDNLAKNSKGFLDFIWDNMWNPGDSNPDLMIGLDFDNINLDYFLLTSELSSLNDNPDYTFASSAYGGLYNQYRHNSLGYLQQEVAKASGSKLSVIKPIIIGGVPQYIFVDGTSDFNQLTMPASTLYQPIIVSPDESVSNEGTITVNIKTVFGANTKGIDHQTSYPEKSIYPSKIPLSSHSFEYPISLIKIELIEENIITNEPRAVESVTFAKDSSMFKTELGNLYFTDNIDTMIIADDTEYNGMISDGLLSSGTTKYYKVTLVFDLIIPADPSSVEHQRMALTQATAYSIMDYMNQYTFAKTTADMIAEIAYTETLTLVSSAISAGSMILGSWAVQGLSGAFTQAGVSLSKQVLFMAGQFAYTTVVGSIKEMFEEIITDAILETWGEKWIKSFGHNDEVAFWFTSLLTSTRESLGGLRSVIQKGLGRTKIGTSLRDGVNKHFGINQNSDTALQNKLIDLVNEANTNKKGKIKNKIDKIKSWKHIAVSGLFGAVTSLIPAIFTGGMFLGNFMSIMGITSQIEGLFGEIIAKTGAQMHLARITGGNYKGDNLRNLIIKPEKVKKPKLGIHKSDLDKEYTTKNLVPMTAIDISRIFNPNFGYERVWVENEYFSPNRFSKYGPNIEYQGGERQPSGQEDMREIISEELKKKRALDSFVSSAAQAFAAYADSIKASLTTEESGKIPETKGIIKWWQSNTEVSISSTTSQPTTLEVINSGKAHFARQRGLYPGIKMALIWELSVPFALSDVEVVNTVFYPGATYITADGRIKTIRNQPLFKIIEEMGLSEFEPEFKLVPLSQIFASEEYQKYISQIYQPPIVSTNSKAIYFTNQEARNFYYKEFDFQFKKQFDEVLQTPEDVKVFESAFELISKVVSRRLWSPVLNIEKSIINEYIFAKTRTLDEFKEHSSSILRSHFESYFKKDLTGMNSIVVNAYKALIDTLYATFTYSRFSNTKETSEVMEILSHQAKFAVLSTIMNKAGITEPDLLTGGFPGKLRQFMTPTNIEEIENIFKSDEGKQIILNSFFASFLVSPNNLKLIKLTSIPQFGYLREVSVILNRLSIKISNKWDHLIEKIEADPKLNYRDLENIRVYDRVSYNPKSGDSVKSFDLKYAPIRFYGRPTKVGRSIDGLGIIEFTTLGETMMTEIKSTMFKNVFAGRYIHDLVTALSHDGISTSIISILVDKITSLDSTAYISLYTSFLGDDTFSTLSNIIEFLKIYFSLDVYGLNNKLQDHELFLMKTIDLINSRIADHNIKELSDTKDFISQSNLERFLKELFDEDLFRSNVIQFARKEFNAYYFIDKLNDGEGFDELFNFLMLNKQDLIYNYDYIAKIGGDHIYGDTLRLGLRHDYGPHFKLPSKLSVTDFLGGQINVYGRVNPLASDSELEEYINKYLGSIAIYHLPGRGDLGIYLVPANLIKEDMYVMYKGQELKIYPGYQDEAGVVHTNIYVADNEGFKLASKFVFSGEGYRIHKRPSWADNERFTQNFEPDQDLFLSDGISAFMTTFYAASTFITGSQVISGLREINLNLEHIEPTREPLPNLQFSTPRKRGARNPQIILRHKTEIKPEILLKGAATASVVNQLSGYIKRRGKDQGTYLLGVSNEFLNSDTEQPRKYSINKFKNILYKLGLKDSDFAQITRGYFEAGSKFHVNSITKLSFYTNWLSIIKGDLNRQGGPLVFGAHPGLDLIPLPFQGTDKEIAMIDAALQDIFGYPAFVSLLAGIMTFAEDSTRSLGYAIDFWNHPYELQSKLLRNFVGRGVYDTHPKDLANTFLSSMKGMRARYWLSLFAIGFRRERVITPATNTLINNYFIRFEPKGFSDYIYASHRLLDAMFSDYMGLSKEIREVNKKGLKGRKEAFSLLYEAFKPAFGKITQKHSGQESFWVNELIKDVMNPFNKVHDVVHLLFNLDKSGTSTSIKLVNSMDRLSTFDFEIDYNTLRESFFNRKLTENFLTTWTYSYNSMHDRATSSYFNDFDIVWDLHQLGFKLSEAYRVISDALGMIPKTSSEIVKVEFYARTENGIDRKVKISGKPGGISTGFMVNEFDIDLNNPSEAIISMLSWMMLEPNIFSVIKWGADNFLYLDIYNLFDQSHIDSGDITNRIQGTFVWGNKPGFTVTKFEELQSEFNAIFQYGDILHFTGFHNHEIDNGFDNIIDYIMDKINSYFVLNGKLPSRGSELFDLR